MNYAVPQLLISNSLTNPLLGTNVTLVNETVIAYDPSRVFYEPIPYEFMFTNETSPQLLVSVDGLDAVCTSMNCSYTYVPPVPSISSFTFSGNTLTINGAYFPV